MSKMNRLHVKQQETLANAAPELLEALENVLRLFANCDDGDNCNCYERTQMIAEQAIVKAKGGWIDEETGEV